MSTTIYACESGEYSDYGVDALFTHREDAELYIKAHGGEIRERTLDPDMTEYRKGLAPHWVIMQRDGTARTVDVVRFLEQDRSNHYESDTYPRDEWIFYMWAKDEKHAVKIANERRTQLLATNRWKP